MVPTDPLYTLATQLSSLSEKEALSFITQTLKGMLMSIRIPHTDC